MYFDLSLSKAESFFLHKVKKTVFVSAINEIKLCIYQ